MFEMALIITVVMALTEFFKRFGVPNRFLPLISLVLGIAGGFLYVDGLGKEKLMYGLMIGLSAAGLFDQSKIITKKDEKQ